MKQVNRCICIFQHALFRASDLDGDFDRAPQYRYYIIMAKPKRYYYLVDNLDPRKGDVIARGLKAIDAVEAVNVDLVQGVVEVVATKNPDLNVQTACEVAGTVLRTKIKKKQLY